MTVNRLQNPVRSITSKHHLFLYSLISLPRLSSPLPLITAGTDLHIYFRTSKCFVCFWRSFRILDAFESLNTKQRAMPSSWSNKAMILSGAVQLVNPLRLIQLSTTYKNQGLYWIYIKRHVPRLFFHHDSFRYIWADHSLLLTEQKTCSIPHPSISI